MPPPEKVPERAQVSLDVVDYDEFGNIVFSGRGTTGYAVRLYVDNHAVGESTASADGRWSFAGAAQIAPGTHRLRVDEVDPSGAVSSRVELPFFREEAAKVAMAAPEAAQVVEQPPAAPEPQPAASEPAVTIEPVPPAAAPSETEVAAALPAQILPKDGRIVIQPGNNLWKLSRVIYGRGVKYTVIYEANKDQIRDADLIYPGQVFMTPNVVPPEKIDPVRRKPLTEEEGGAVVQ